MVTTYVGAVPSTLDSNGVDAVSFDNSNGRFTFDTDDAGLAGKTYELTLSAAIDGKFTATGDFDLIIRHPCKFSETVEISTVSMDDRTY